jgi:hypothetical protein
MNEQVTFGVAGNVFAPALAELNAMGFRVSPGPTVAGERTYRAEGAAAVVTAPDTLQLLALAVLASRRGTNATRPSDAEIAALLALDGAV